jgi:hypothetical protein
MRMKLNDINEILIMGVDVIILLIAILSTVGIIALQITRPLSTTATSTVGLVVFDFKWVLYGLFLIFNVGGMVYLWRKKSKIGVGILAILLIIFLLIVIATMFNLSIYSIIPPNQTLPTQSSR